MTKKNNDIENKDKKVTKKAIENRASNKVNSSRKVSTKNNSTKKSSSTKASNSKSKNVDLELTNALDITFDDVRLDDVDSLDTSFMEGKKKKVKLEKNADLKVKDAKKEKNKKKEKHDGIFTYLILIFFILVLLVFVYILYNQYNDNNKIKTKTITKVVTEKIVDDNFVFLGDSITNGYDLEEYYEGLFVVNSGIDGNTTKDILSDMGNRVYRYNPSKVFLLIGTNDINNGISSEDIVSNIEEIIDGIKENRPYCEIYLESIYPVRDSSCEDDKCENVDNRSNSVISNINKELEILAEEKDITYIDIYSLLEDEDGYLKSEYTEDGLHITSEGYKVITEELKKYISE